METDGDKYGSLWSREELVLALYLYCQIPFGQTSSRNKEVIQLASLLGRTPSSVARKLGNFGAFDPVLAARGVVGLTHASKADRAVWDEFYGRWNSLVAESRGLLSKKGEAENLLRQYELDGGDAFADYVGVTTKSQSVSVRLCQAFFRRAVLASYTNECCVCGLDLPPLLTASHIVPWSVNELLRADPQNGLCLCALHDRAFDRGIISVGKSFKIAVSSRVDSSRAEIAGPMILCYRNMPISLPKRFAPKPEYLQWHFGNVFQR